MARIRTMRQGYAAAAAAAAPTSPVECDRQSDRGLTTLTHRMCSCAAACGLLRSAQLLRTGDCEGLKAGGSSSEMPVTHGSSRLFYSLHPSTSELLSAH